MSHDIGDLVFEELGREGRLACDGAQYLIETYPELAPILAAVGHGYDFMASPLSGVPNPGTVYGAAFSPDGRYLAMGVYGGLKVIDTTTWTLVAAAPTLSGNGQRPSFSPDGRYLAFPYTVSPYLAIIDTQDWSIVPGTPTLPGNGNQADFSPDGALLAISHSTSPGLMVLETQTWTPVETGWSAGTHGAGVVFSPDGSQLAVSASSSVYLLETAAWTTVTTLQPGAATGRASFTADGHYLAVGMTASPYLAVYGATDWQPMSGLPVLTEATNHVVFSPEGDYLAVIGANTLRAIATRDWSEVPSYARARTMYAADFSPDGRYLAIGGLQGSGPSCLEALPVRSVVPDGYFQVPTIPDQLIGNLVAPVLIQAEA